MDRSARLFAPQAAESGGTLPVPAAKPPNAFTPPRPPPLPSPGPVPVPAAKPPNAFTPPKPDSPAAAPAAPGAPGAPAPGEAPPGATKIRAFEQRLGAGQSQENWKRKANVTGTGATHVKSFHCKLGADSLEFLDKQINEWLEAHPEYEVKLVTSTVGEWQGKIKEPALIVQVWV